MTIERGEIRYVDWSPGRGSEQRGERPALVIQNDLANRHATYSNTIVLALTTTVRNIPQHLKLEPTEENGLTAISEVMCEQVFTVDKQRLGRRLGRVTPAQMAEIEAKLRRVLGFS